MAATEDVTKPTWRTWLLTGWGWGWEPVCGKPVITGSTASMLAMATIRPCLTNDPGLANRAVQESRPVLEQVSLYIRFIANFPVSSVPRRQLRTQAHFSTMTWAWLSGCGSDLATRHAITGFRGKPALPDARATALNAGTAYGTTQLVRPLVGRTAHVFRPNSRAEDRR